MATNGGSWYSYTAQAGNLDVSLHLAAVEDVTCRTLDGTEKTCGRSERASWELLELDFGLVSGNAVETNKIQWLVLSFHWTCRKIRCITLSPFFDKPKNSINLTDLGFIQFHPCSSVNIAFTIVAGGVLKRTPNLWNVARCCWYLLITSDFVWLSQLHKVKVTISCHIPHLFPTFSPTSRARRRWGSSGPLPCRGSTRSPPTWPVASCCWTPCCAGLRRSCWWPRSCEVPWMSSLGGLGGEIR